MPANLDALTLVLSSQRSGSTLLCWDIESLGGLGAPREHFLGLHEQAARSPVTEADILDRIARGATDSDPHVGAVKLMISYTSFIDAAIHGRQRRGPLPALRRVVGWAAQSFDRVFLVILVRNALDQAISRAVAATTDVYHASDAADLSRVATAELVPEVLNPLILNQLRKVLEHRRVLTEVATEFGDLALLLTYDDLTVRTAATTQRLIAHATAHGFTPRRTTVTRSLLKVIDTERRDRLRESFLAHLRTESGL